MIVGKKEKETCVCVHVFELANLINNANVNSGSLEPQCHDSIWSYISKQMA